MARIMSGFNPERPFTALDIEAGEALVGQVLDFFADRLKVQQREAGGRHGPIDAAFVLGGEAECARLLARVNALQAFVATEDSANLLTEYRRAANILKKEGWDVPAETASEAGEGDPLAALDDPDVA